MLLTKHINLKDQAKESAIGWTVFNVVGFPLLSLIAGMGGLMFDCPITGYAGGAFMLVSALTPLSIPLSLIMMWICYFCKFYEKVRFFGRISITLCIISFPLSLLLYPFVFFSSL